MGIPSYFSYIIKNYSNIIRNFADYKSSSFQHFYLDCNSIIYDCFNHLSSLYEMNYCNKDEFENQLITMVIHKIKIYVEMIKPTNTLFIAFDGVAPFAKMDQQRTRRYKSTHTKAKHIPLTSFNTVLNEKCHKSNTKPADEFSRKLPVTDLTQIGVDLYKTPIIDMDTGSNPDPLKPPKIIWSTLLITPGTDFMNKLSICLENEFVNNHKSQKTNSYKTFVSSTTEIGEGEHKLFQHIRSYSNMIYDQVVVYGLDSDLLMLSIFHLKYCSNIFIFRESPAFGGEFKDKTNEFCLLDMGLFSTSIVNEMGCKFSETFRIYDYAFMCFFLGNDFLPHFPSLNIRTHGIQILLDLYRLYIGKYQNRYFISPENQTIQWRWVRLFVGELAKKEHSFLMTEYFVRNKWDQHSWLDHTPEEKEKILESIPVIYRAEEKYICPSERFWESRYYKVLFENGIKYENEGKRKNICVNYLEGLEWVFKYYTRECPDWKWKYHYHYPPLFSDLIGYISHHQIEYFCHPPNKTVFSPKVQLFYVFPLGQMDDSFLQPEWREHYEKNKEYYPEGKLKYKWAFCRYFWESHIYLPEISIETLEKWDSDSTH